MKPAKTLFESLYNEPNATLLNVGAPGPATLKKCAALMKKATDIRLEKEIQDDAALLQYGPPQGDPAYISQLARFLSAEYGDAVDETNLVTNAGATSGLLVLLSILFPQRCPIFVEELSYHLALNMFNDDLKFPLFPISMDEDGLNLDSLRHELDVARKQQDRLPVPEHQYWAVLYSIPIFHNPTGRCLSEEKAKQLVELARENRVLVITEDVYNLLYYEGTAPPKRLFAYDRERAKIRGDEHGGCVVSNGTFSKLLTPGLRLGWLEVPPWVRKKWDQSATLFSGGSLNMYTSGLVASALETGLVQGFLKHLREEYKRRRDAMVQIFKARLPAGCRLEVPKGGYFIWITLPEDVKVSRVQEIAKRQYKIFIQEGPKFCVPEAATKYGHCLRVAISYHEVDTLTDAAEKLSVVITNCANDSKK